jgi:hypothetical protein
MVLPASAAALLRRSFRSLAGIIGALTGFVAIMDQGVIPKICPVAASGGAGMAGQGGSQR